MAREFAKSFYNSKAWKVTRLTVLEREHFLCERCGEPASQVHHKIWLRPDNINDPNITLNLENLEALCETCHQHEHYLQDRGYAFDEEGNIIKKESNKLRPVWRS